MAATQYLTDEQKAKIEPLLPPEKPGSKGGETPGLQPGSPGGHSLDHANPRSREELACWIPGWAIAAAWWFAMNVC